MAALLIFLILVAAVLQISVGGSDNSNSSWGIETFTRMLKQGPPLLMKTQ